MYIFFDKLCMLDFGGSFFVLKSYLKLVCTRTATSTLLWDLQFLLFPCHEILVLILDLVRSFQNWSLQWTLKIIWFFMRKQQNLVKNTNIRTNILNCHKNIFAFQNAWFHTLMHPYTTSELGGVADL